MCEMSCPIDAAVEPFRSRPPGRLRLLIPGQSGGCSSPSEMESSHGRMRLDKSDISDDARGVTHEVGHHTLPAELGGFQPAWQTQFERERPSRWHPRCSPSQEWPVLTNRHHRFCSQRRARPHHACSRGRHPARRSPRGACSLPLAGRPRPPTNQRRRPGGQTPDSSSRPTADPSLLRHVRHHPRPSTRWQQSGTLARSTSVRSSSDRAPKRGGTTHRENRGLSGCPWVDARMRAHQIGRFP